jgi:hypothetical protein
MSSLGGNDEEDAEKQDAAREPKIKRGATLGTRDQKDAKPLLRIDELAAGLRTDEMIGAEVRSSDDKIVGEVRNIVFATKDGRDYAIVASDRAIEVAVLSFDHLGTGYHSSAPQSEARGHRSPNR